MHIILFGGAFDPPHNGHKHAAESVLQRKIADEVWLIPCFQHPFDKDLSPAKDRLAMLSFLESPTVKVNEYEIAQHTISYSIDTLKHFSSTQPQHTFSWLIGSDIVPTFHKWKQYEDLLHSFKVYVYPRIGYPMQTTYEEMHLLHDFPMVDDSSTIIRQRIKEKLDIHNLVLPEVARYISEHSLYNTPNE